MQPYASRRKSVKATLGLGTRRVRLVAAALALVTIPVGATWTAAGQIGMLTAIVAGCLVAESLTRGAKLTPSSPAAKVPGM